MSQHRTDYLTKAQVVELTGLSPNTIAKRTKAGVLNPIKSSLDTRMNLYRRDEVEALLQPQAAH